MANIRRGEIPIPAHAHPLVRRFVALANRKELSMRQISRLSGNPHQIMSLWASRSNPRIDTFEAALNALGYRLVIVERR